MTWWGVVLRGIRHRAGRSTVVLLVAAVAVAAAVLVPGFSRAAQQSVLTDGLDSARPAAVGLTIGAAGTAGSNPHAHQPTADTRLLVDNALADLPVLQRTLGPPVGGVDVAVTAHAADSALAGRLAYRDQICQHLQITVGDCPIDAGQVLVSARTAGEFDIAPGDELTVQYAQQHRPLRVVGLYQPADEQHPYWGRTVYFTHGGFDPASGLPRIDAIFTPAEPDVQADADTATNLALTYPLDVGELRLDDVAALRAELAELHNQLRVATLELDTALLAILDEVAADQQAIARTAPVIAVPLLLLAFAVLFLLVASLTEERGREVALAKLRGFAGAQATRFGLGEVLTLIGAAAPVGLLLGLAVVELVSRLALAESTGVQLRPPVLLAAAAALVAAAAAAVLAGRSTLRRGVLTLLRRVPARGGWRAGVVEGMVVALAAASLFAALNDRSSPLALLAPALLAVVAGIAVARLVRLWAALRLRAARRRGRIPALLSAAQLSRRPAGRRVIVVVTVAVALLTFAAVAWDIAAQARHDYAVDTVGADRVYTVTAAHPTALATAVSEVDPDGHTMAVVRSRGQYAGQPVELLGVQSDRLAQVAQWRGQPDPTELAGALAPARPQPLRLGEDLAVDLDTTALGDQPVRLSALVSEPGEPPRTVPLGTLTSGSQRYHADLPSCAAGQCHLLGLVLGRTGAAGAFTATVTIEQLRSHGEVVPARLDQTSAWRLPDPTAAELRTSSTLTVEITGGYDGDVLLEVATGAPAQPVVLAGPAPAEDRAAAHFSFPGFSQRPEQFHVVATAAQLPRAGDHGLLFDLDHAVLVAQRSAALADSPLTYEVWAAPQAPADLVARLAAAGVAVQSEQTLAGTHEVLSRRAPALSFWLYLLAAAAAVALALGAVALSSRVGVADRLHDLGALQVAGVPESTLRRGLLREYLSLLGWPLLAGLGAGLVAAALMLPGMPLVEVGHTTGIPAYDGAGGVLPAAVLVTVAGLVVVAAGVVRLPRRAHTVRLGREWT